MHLILQGFGTCLTYLKDELTDPTKNTGMYWSNINVRYLPRPSDTVAFICNGYAVVLIMAESNLSNLNVPVIHNELTAKEALLQVDPSVIIKQIVVVDENDYTNAEKYANSIRDVFTSIFMPVKPNIRHLLETNITVSDSPLDYAAAYSKLSPHSVPLRCDLTLTVYSQPKNPGNYNPQNWMQQREQDYYFSNPELANRDVLATIGGYVEVVRHMSSYNGKYVYIPIIHITEIQSGVIADEMLPICIVIAANRWLFANGWHKWFIDHMKNAHGNAADIGCFISDRDGGVLRAGTEADFYKILYENFMAGQIVLDVVDGRFTIPGILKLASRDVSVAQEVTNSYMAFFRNNNNNIMPYQGPMPYMVADVQYRGTYMLGTKVLDTACIDYMNEVLIHPTDSLRCEKLLLRKANPIAAVMDQRQFEPDLKLLYRADIVLFVPSYITWLNSNMPGLNMFCNGQHMGLADLSAIAANAEEWNKAMQNPQYGGYAAYPYFNPTDRIYMAPMMQPQMPQ